MPAEVSIGAERRERLTEDLAAEMVEVHRQMGSAVTLTARMGFAREYLALGEAAKEIEWIRGSKGEIR